MQTYLSEQMRPKNCFQKKISPMKILSKGKFTFEVSAKSRIPTHLVKNNSGPCVLNFSILGPKTRKSRFYSILILEFNLPNYTGYRYTNILTEPLSFLETYTNVFLKFTIMHQNNHHTVDCFKGTVSRDFRPSVFSSNNPP
jgi:hypothetical protein